MKKKLTLWILLLPAALFAQVEMKDGGITIDFNKKKGKQAQTDTTQKQEPQVEEEEKPAKNKKEKSSLAKEEDEDDPNFKREGLFKALFIAGLNLSQVDGDDQAGYVHPGANAGVGVMIKFHKYVSVSAGITYSMKGAYKKLNAAESRPYSFRINWDYVQVPIMLNVHDKKLVMAGVGLSLSYMVRNKFTYSSSVDTTTHLEPIPYYAAYVAEPKKFDLCFVGGFQFLIKRVLGIGAEFQYSLIGLKPAVPNAKVKNMFNNTVTLRLMYILDPVSFKKKK